VTNPKDDLLRLPPLVAEAATVDENGEVWWTAQYGEAAINALADAGFVILGLDLREYDSAGHFIEVAWSDYRHTGLRDVELGRAAALEDALPDFLPRIGDDVARPTVQGLRCGGFGACTLEFCT